MRPNLILISLLAVVASVMMSVSGDEDYLETLLDNYLTSEMRRDKKSRNNENENAPLSSHGRKSFFESPTSSTTCSISNMRVESNVMVDSKSSLKNGARFLRVDRVSLGTSKKLSDLHESCSKICCEDEDGCDTALLSLKLGEVLYLSIAKRVYPKNT